MCISDSNDGSRPVTPVHDDCCHNACEPCIFDIHKKLLEEYDRRKKQKIKIQNKMNVLNLCSYRNFEVIDIREVSDDYIFLLLRYQDSDLTSNRKILIDPGQHVVLHINDTTKPFTPIDYTDDTIKFLIKHYPNGKCSTYLINTKIGDIVRIRGPYGNFKYESNSFQTIIMFSIGSGISAVYPIARSIVENEFEETRIHLIGGFQTISQIPLKKELQLLSDYWNFKCTLHISQWHCDAFSIHGVTIKHGRLDKNSVSEVLKNHTPNTTLILICGTRDFNQSIEQWVKALSYAHMHIFQ